MTKEEFKICFDQYFDAIRKYIYYRSNDVDLATDVAQDIFLKLWEKQSPYEGKRTKSLLYKMASDRFISLVRKKQVQNNYLNSIQLNFKDNSPEDLLDYKELKHYYEKALAELPEKQRSVFLMSRVEELTYSEIASRLDISIKTVEMRMSKTLTSLRKLYKSHG